MWFNKSHLKTIDDDLCIQQKRSACCAKSMLSITAVELSKLVNVDNAIFTINLIGK